MSSRLNPWWKPHSQIPSSPSGVYPTISYEAQDHLNFAINEFREMKMQPSLERALRHKQILGA